MPSAVLREQDPATRTYLGSPSLTRLPDGAWLATHDYFGPGCPLNHEAEEHLTTVYRSTDGGRTWRDLTHVAGAYWSTLFTHAGAVYLLGTSQQYGAIVIRRSTDGGHTWTHPADAATGLLFAGGPRREPPNYHGAPVPVLLHQGRLYRAFEDYRPDVPTRGWWAPGFHACVISCAADADLLRRESWTMTNKLAFAADWVPPAWGRLDAPGWLEGNVVVAPDGGLVNIMRLHAAPLWDRAALLRLDAAGCRLTFDPGDGLLDLPGGHTKFTIRHDPRTGLYLTLSNGNDSPDPARHTNRSVLGLYASADLRTWRRCTVVRRPDPVLTPQQAFHLIGYQYVDWQFDGEDLVLLVRTAEDGAPNFHDANRIICHRLERFRDLL